MLCEIIYMHSKENLDLSHESILADIFDQFSFLWL